MHFLGNDFALSIIDEYLSHVHFQTMDRSDYDIAGPSARGGE